MSAHSEDRELSQTIASALQKVLDRHGYGFHYRVLKDADELFRNRRSISIWLKSVEVPINHAKPGKAAVTEGNRIPAVIVSNDLVSLIHWFPPKEVLAYLMYSGINPAIPAPSGNGPIEKPAIVSPRPTGTAAHENPKRKSKGFSPCVGGVLAL
jgi:hypothetical protein